MAQKCAKKITVRICSHCTSTMCCSGKKFPLLMTKKSLDQKYQKLPAKTPTKKTKCNQQIEGQKNITHIKT